MGCVYLITCVVNNKQYIGMTKHTGRKRLSQHVYDAQCHKREFRSKLFNAIRQHGRENFIVEEIFHHTDTSTLIEREKVEIRDRNTFRNGLNCTEGGEGWGVKEPWNKGKPHSELTKSKLRAKRVENNHLINSPEVRARKSISMTGKRYSKFNRDARSGSWLVITPDNNLLVIDNLYSFCKQRKLCSPAMTNVANGKLKQNNEYKCYRLTPGPTRNQQCLSARVPVELIPVLEKMYPDRDFSQNQLPLLN